MYAFEEESWASKAVEIGTWVLLFIVLVPGSALAYFAENSIPTSPLYPIKRDLEAVVLQLVSVNSSTKTFYQLNLAHTRVTEMRALLASSNTPAPQYSQQLGIVSAQLIETKKSINTIHDPVQQAELRSQLQTSITEYHQQLTTLHEQLQNSQTPPDTITPTPTIQAKSTASDNIAHTPTSTPIPTSDAVLISPTATKPAPNITTLTPEQKQELENTIRQESEQLQQLQEDLQQNNASEHNTHAQKNQDENHAHDEQHGNHGGNHNQ